MKKMIAKMAIILTFISGVVFAANPSSYESPVYTIKTPAKTSGAEIPLPAVKPPPNAPAPAVAPEAPVKPRINITIPDFSDTYEKNPRTPTGAAVIVKALEANSNEPISGATVKWYGVNYTTGGTTDVRGEARLSWVPLGEAKIRCDAAGYAYNSKVVWVQSGIGVQYFDIYLSKAAKNISSAETPPILTVITPKKPEAVGKATISGTVYDKATRQPISGAAVKAYNAGYRQDLIQDVKTNQSGRYTIDNCPLDAAVKIMYGKPGYTQQDIPRYIPKVATVYTQDVYLEKTVSEMKKPKEDEGSGEKRGDIETTQRALEEEEYINCGIVYAELGEAELSGDYIELPYGWWPLHIRYRNLGPDNARDVRVTRIITDFSNFTETGDVIEQRPVLNRNEHRECDEMLYFHPGFYNIYVEACSWSFWEDEQIETDRSDDSRYAGVHFYEREDGADVDIELLTFNIDGEPVGSNPTFDIGNGEHLIYVQLTNHGPQETTGVTRVTVTKVRQGIYSEYIALRGVGEIVSRGIYHTFTPGTYNLECEVTPYAMDHDINADWEEYFRKSRGRVTFTGVSPITREMIDSVGRILERRIEGTVLTPRDEPAETEPAEGESADQPPSSGRESRQTNIGLVSFNVEGQPVTGNPTVQIADNQPVTLSFAAINNGPDDANGPCAINLSGIGLSGSQPVDLRRRVNVLMGNSMQRNFALGTYNFTATIESAAGDEDSDRSNNTISGAVSFVPATNAAAGPDGQPDGGQPDDGQPDGGQPDNGQPDDGQPDGGQPDGGQPDGGQPDNGQPGSGQGPGGWNPFGGGQQPAAGPGMIPAVPPAFQQPGAGFPGAGGIPPAGLPQAQNVTTEDSAAEPAADEAVPLTAELPQMGRVPEPQKKISEQGEYKEQEELPNGKEKNKILWPILASVAVFLLIILVVITRKKKT